MSQFWSTLISHWVDHGCMDFKSIHHNNLVFTAHTRFPSLSLVKFYFFSLCQFLLTARGLFWEKFLCGCWALSISRKHEIGLDFHPPVPPMFRDVNKSCCWSSLPLTKVRYRWWFHSGVDEKNFTILKTWERLQSNYIVRKSNKPLTAVMIGSSTRKKCIWVSHYVAFPNLQRCSCSRLSLWSYMNQGWSYHLICSPPSTHL